MILIIEYSIIQISLEKVLISLKKDINKKNFFQLSMTLLKKIYISIQKHQYLLHLYLVLKKKILLKKILLKKIIFGRKVVWMNGKKIIIVLFLTIRGKVTKIIMINYLFSYFFHICTYQYLHIIKIILKVFQVVLVIFHHQA